jgi:long-subunit fatty acid transport protein
MKKLLTFSLSVCLSGVMFAGGLVTNTNQSASFTRLQCRDATLGIDAVYYNPAGLTKLNDGFHLSLNNQTLGQTQTITSDYVLLKGTPKKYTGDVSAPFFPGIYAAYKTGKLALSVGFNPIGGGGGAEYNAGLPSFETMISEVVPLLKGSLAPLDAGVEAATTMNPQFKNITSYNSNIYFKGSSVYFGVQANASYAISDMISVALGARYVTAKNTYKGYIKDVTIVAAPNALMPGLAGLVGTFTPGNYLRAIAATPYATAAAASLTGTGLYLDAATNVNADVEETGTGITPIISVNLSPSEKLNIAIKYELKTKLELTTKVNDSKNAGGMWTDGGKKTADMPAQLVVGLSYKPMDKLLVSTGVHYYFDKAIDYDGTSDSIVTPTGKVGNLNMIEKNFIEYALGLQYGISDKINVSAGWLTTITGVNANYQDDLSYSLNTNTFGGGLEYRLNDMIGVNLAGSYTLYKDGTVDKTSGKTGLPYTLSLDKNVWIVSVGLDFSF